jgi:hypothetical protein
MRPITPNPQKYPVFSPLKVRLSLEPPGTDYPNNPRRSSQAKLSPDAVFAAVAFRQMLRLGTTNANNCGLVFRTPHSDIH